MAQLTIALLGTFEVARDGIAVTQFEADTARALLAYLAMRAGIAHPREVLAALLWPNQPESEALHALRQALNRVRNAIGDRNADTPFLRITRGDIQFDPGSDYDLDVKAFAALIAATRQHPHRRLETCRTCMGRLRQAAELYRNDLLHGFFLNSRPFEEWLVVQREHLHRQAVEALYQLAAYHEQRGEYEQSRQYAWRQVELEAWREEAHQQIMRVLALSGQRSAALAQYQRCCQILSQELGVEPAQETTRLYEQILAGNLVPPKAQQHNLPVQLTPFVGRESELAHIADSLSHPICRLLTLVGAGGIGKTRLALRAAEEEKGAFQHGVRFVPLSAIASPDLLITAIAQSLQISLVSQEDPQTQVLNYLREKELLLVLDNFEHLLAATGQVTQLLQGAPNLRILITSRERLNVQAEWLYEVKGLECSGSAPLRSLESSAAQLFVQSARRICPDFALSSANQEAVWQICRLVEGMPLAIELAASWTRVLACPDIAQEIERDLDFLKTSFQDVPERHRSLRAVLDSSWNLLSPEESNLLCKLSVFQSGFRFAAAQAAGATLPLITALVNKSVLRQYTYADDASAVRYEMHDLLLRYAAEKLAGEPELEAATRDQHGRYYLGFLQQQETSLKGGAQREALNAIGDEIKNVRAAWQWALSHKQVAQFDQALDSLFLYYDARSWFKEGEEIFASLAQAMSDAQTHDEKTVLGRVLACQGWFVCQLGHYTQARVLIQQGLGLLQALGAQQFLPRALNHLGAVAFNQNELDEAQTLCLESLSICQEAGNHYDAAIAHSHLGRVAYLQGNYAEAQQRCRACLDLARAAGLHQIEAANLRQLGIVYWHIGEYVEARHHFELALHIYRELGDRQGEGRSIISLGTVAERLGEYVQARAYYEQTLAISRETGNRKDESAALNNLGVVYDSLGDYSAAQTVYKQALLIRQEIGDRQSEGMTLGNLGVSLYSVGAYEEARAYYQKALLIAREIDNRRREGNTLTDLSLLAGCLGDNENAHIYGQQALLIAQQLPDSNLEGNAWIAIGHALAAMVRFSEAAQAYQKAFELRRDVGQMHLAMEPLAGLARISLAQGETRQAQTQVEEILSYLETNALYGTSEPFRIYLTCYHVLRASNDSRADSLLKTAHDALQGVASKISNASQRRSFLENVDVHREIVYEWLNYESRRLCHPSAP